MGATDIKDPILIVDDDRNTTALIGAYLEKEGFPAIFAHDGQQALDFARRYTPTLVIHDQDGTSDDRGSHRRLRHEGASRRGSRGVSADSPPDSRWDGRSGKGIG